MTNSSNTETTEGIELGRTSYKSRKVGGRISGIDVKGFLEFEGEAVEILGDEVQAPDGDFRR